MASEMAALEESYSGEDRSLSKSEKMMKEINA